MPAAVDLPPKKCNGCGDIFGRRRDEAASDYRPRLFCSRDCYHDFARGENHPLYKLGGALTPFGYVRATDPGGSKYRGHIHRIVMAQQLGRPLRRNELVHHKDHNPLNNSPTNLVVMSPREHALLHSRKRKRRDDGSYA